MKKFKLEDSLFTDEISVFGLVSEWPSYRLCFHINNALSLRLNRLKEDKRYYYSNKPYFFTSYQYRNSKYDLMWSLVENKSFLEENPGEISRPVIPSQKIFDYFLCCEGEDLSEIRHHLKGELKRLMYVRTFKELDTDSIKNIETLFINE